MITHTERKIAFNMYLLLVFMMMLFYLIGVALPFLASFVGGGECSSVSPLYVYMGYGAFIVISTIAEIIIIN
jgi:hypothetical protein